MFKACSACSHPLPYPFLFLFVSLFAVRRLLFARSPVYDISFDRSPITISYSLERARDLPFTSLPSLMTVYPLFSAVSVGPFVLFAVRSWIGS
ncbi:hypothetical protein HOY80DRAFT_959945 [Tuber brumale]|nr:hypothetical protein HOY80DRAFT_959945 [Tuber brumale]